MHVVLADGWVDGSSGEVHRTRPDRLRPRELALLRYLAERPGVTVGRAELYAAVWGYHPDSRSRTLDTTLRRVREAVEPEPGAPVLLVTEAGVGVRFEPPALEPAEAHAAAGVRGLRAGEDVVLWGPPGVGRTFWLQRSGLPGVDDAPGPVAGLSTRRLRPREPGVRAVEVTPLPEAAARSLVARRLRALGAEVGVPQDLGPWDGLPAALLAAADRAARVGRFEVTTDDALSARFAEEVGGDRALGAVASLPGGLPVAVVTALVGEGVVRSWLDRGLARREGLVVRALAHVARVAPVDPALAAALRDRGRRAFDAAVHPLLGPTTPADRALATALARNLPDHPWAAALLGRPVPEPEGDDGLAAWARAATDPARTLARVEAQPPSAARSALRAMALRRSGALPASAEGAPDPADRSLEAGEWAWQRSLSAAYAGDPAQAAEWGRAALDRWAGHPLLEERAAGGLSHGLIQLGRVDEAAALLAPLVEREPGTAAEALLGLAFVGLTRLDAAAAAASARRARDLIPALPAMLAAQVAVQVMVVFRELGDHENARATGLTVFRAPEPLPARVTAHAHYAFGSALLEAGEPEAASGHFGRAREVAGADELGSAAALGSALAAAELGRPDEARAHVAAATAGGPSARRTGRLVQALASAVVPVDPAALDDTLAFADATFDRALGGVARLARGLSADEAAARCSSEIRLARRWFDRWPRAGA